MTKNKRTFEFFYPAINRGGSGSFISITVWKSELLRPFDEAGWYIIPKILEGRLVLLNVIVKSKLKIFDIEEWDLAEIEAEYLKNIWMKKLKFFTKWIEPIHNYRLSTIFRKLIKYL